MAAGHDEIRAGFRQGAGENLAEAAAGAGDNGYLAGEIEEFVGGVWAHDAFPRGQNHLYQIRFAGVQTREPCGASVERSNGGNQAA